MIRIGIICPSEIAFRRFLPSLKLAEGFEYVGVAIASKEEFVGATDEILAKERQKAQTFVDNYGGKIFDGYGTMISSDEIDAIYLPLPPALHFKWAEKALLNNKHVFVEKPSTTCLKDTQRLVELAMERNLALHEDYMFVFHNQLEAINDIIRSGEIGDVRLYRITFGFPRRDARDFRYNKALGGGALLDAGGYTMKYATTLLGMSGKLVAATANYLPGFEVDMYGSATMVNDDGVVAQLAFGMDNDYKCDVEIWCSKGTLTSSRVLTAPTGFVPTCTIKKNQEYETRALPADDSFLKSIQRFGLCVKDDAVRKENYELIEHQEALVEKFRELSKMDCYTIHDCTLIDIATFTDERGAISVIDKELPFQVKRVFWLHHIAEGKDRGAHALLEGMEIMVAVHGSFEVDLDDGTEKTSILLNDPSKGLIIRPGVWFRTHSYKEDGVSLILADEEYSRDRYTYDYEKFLKWRV